MARAIWSGAISFGLLNVPVRLYSAVARRGIALREIRESDGARIRHRRVAEGSEEEVPYESTVKAFEITPGRYVALNKEELASIEPQKSRAIEVQDFVEIAEIDPIYFESPYYLGPQSGAEKAYSLLARAMAGSGKVAIARFVFRNKEHLAAIRPAGDVLTLTTMRFADEVVEPSELADAFAPESPKLAKRELEMAQKLIDSLTRSFDPTAYRDEHREALLAMIERKAEGEEIVKPPAGAELEPTRAPDLMAALERSIAAVGDRGKPGKEKAKKRPAAPKAKAAPKRAARRAKSSSST